MERETGLEPATFCLEILFKPFSSIPNYSPLTKKTHENNLNCLVSCVTYLQGITRSQQERGTLIDPATMTFAELLDICLATKKGNISPNSMQDYERAARLHIKPGIGFGKVQKLTPDRLQAEYAACQAAGMSPRMVHRCHIVLSQALAQAVRFGLIHHNIAQDVTGPSLSRGKPNVWGLAPAEVRRSSLWPPLTRSRHFGTCWHWKERDAGKP